MTFSDYLCRQTALHPSVQPQDLIKQCYQAAYGAEHLLHQMQEAEAYFMQEYEAAQAADLPLTEPIGAEVSRVNLAAWKKSGMPAAWLFRLFARSAQMAQGGDENFHRNLAEADAFVKAGGVGFSYELWTACLKAYLQYGCGAVHHSAEYRAQEHPAYRVVCNRLTRLIPVLQRIAAAEKTDCPMVIALDGPAASGKTTVAEQLAEVLGGSIIHMDDFFLPQELRTEKRLAEPGGNVHYERFAEEVLPQLKCVEDFSYRRFSCHELAYVGEQTVAARPYYLVEGSYSHHPRFGDYADLRVFTEVECEEQMRRIIRRNGAEQAERFRARWIPMEERYFDTCRIREKADLSI